MKRNHGHPRAGQPLTVKMTDFAIQSMRRLPRVCITTQQRKALSGLVKLNQLMSASAAHINNPAKFEASPRLRKAA